MRRRSGVVVGRLGAVSTVVVVLLLLLLSLFSSARALKTKKVVSSLKSSSSSSGEEDDGETHHRHLLDPALNTDEVRAAASTIGHIEDMDAYLGLRGGFNINEMSDVPADRMKAWGRLYMQPVHMQERVKKMEPLLS